MITITIVNFALIWIMILINLLLTLAIARRVVKLQGFDSQLEAIKPGSVAPPFQAKTLNGDVVSENMYSKGKPIALFFIGPNCQPCKDLLPMLVELSPSARQANIEILLVSNQNAAKTEEEMNSFHLPYPILLAPLEESSFFTDYKIRGTPSYCLVDTTGRVKASGYPGMKLEKFRNSLSI